MRATVLFVSLAGFVASAASGQTPSAPAAPAPQGWEITGIPALNFNSDEGLGYGAIVQAFNYGTGVRPYRLTIQPTVLLTTRGRRDLILFVDAPHLLPGGLRWSAYLAKERHLATPFYGIGNATARDEARELEPNPYYYRYGRSGARITSDIQRPVARNVRLLAGAGLRTSSIDATPFDSGTTLLAEQTAGGPIPTSRSVYARAGVVFDTRDREVGPRSGVWAEALAQRTGKVLGGTNAFTRMTLTARGYYSPLDRLTIAERIIVQQVSGDAPFQDLFVVQSSFKDEEGLGGSVTLRGWPKNRFAGKGLVLLNNEARFRALDFNIGARPSSLVLSGFVDAGRVWDDRLRVGEIASDLHVGLGGGVRLAYGPSFVVAVDAGRSAESAAAIYIGLGFLY